MCSGQNLTQRTSPGFSSGGKYNGAILKAEVMGCGDLTRCEVCEKEDENKKDYHVFRLAE